MESVETLREKLLAAGKQYHQLAAHIEHQQAAIRDADAAMSRLSAEMTRLERAIRDAQSAKPAQPEGPEPSRPVSMGWDRGSRDVTVLGRVVTAKGGGAKMLTVTELGERMSGIVDRAFDKLVQATPIQVSQLTCDLLRLSGEQLSAIGQPVELPKAELGSIAFRRSDPARVVQPGVVPQGGWAGGTLFGHLTSGELLSLITKLAAKVAKAGGLQSAEPNTIQALHEAVRAWRFRNQNPATPDDGLSVVHVSFAREVTLRVRAFIALESLKLATISGDAKRREDAARELRLAEDEFNQLTGTIAELEPTRRPGTPRSRRSKLTGGIWWQE